MPLTTETFDLEETADRKREEREDVADQAAAIDADNPAFEDLARRGTKLDTHIRGLEWAIDNWDVDEITIAGMTGGEVAKMEDELAKDGNGMGSARIATVVHGTETAPFLGDSDAETYAAVGQLPHALQAWIEDEVNEMTEVGNGDTTFASLLKEKRQQADGTASSE